MNETMHERFSRIVKEEMSKEGEAIDKFQKAQAIASIDMIEHFPMWMKFNFILNQIDKSNLEEIDWDRVNKILQANPQDGDFNVFDNINCVDDLLDARDRCIEAQLVDSLPYHQKICKTCNHEFTISYSEISFFENKGLKLPKRCEYCRKGVKRPEPVKVIKIEETPVKSAMQIAFEKAGIV